jgi:NADPH:quinone reductase-like Zn-dependent oxidoreductase
MGADGAGVVDQCGPAVTRVRPGDRVMLNPGVSCGTCDWCLTGEQPLCPNFQMLGEHRSGTSAEYVVVPERNLALLSPTMPWNEAAGFSVATLTAWRMLVTRAKLLAGETVLIWGIGGGVALAALRVAKLIGARAIVTSSSDEKLSRAKALGADEALNHSKIDVAQEVRRLTGRRGAEVVVDSVGEQTWEQSLRCLSRLGRLVTCGGTTGPRVTTDVRRLFWYQWTILGSTMGNQEEYRRVSALAAQGALWPLVDKVYPLTQARNAFARLRAGDQMGKILIEVGA